MRLLEKLERLRRLEDTVTYRWTAGRRRIEGGYVNLSDLRLCCLSKSGDALTFSSSAPYLAYRGHRQQVQFSDTDMLTVVSGQRSGMVIPASFLHDDEEGVDAPCCCHRAVTDDDCPRWLEHKILSMGTSLVFPSQGIEMPELFRLSKNVESLRPVVSNRLLAQLGLRKGTPLEEITEAFHDKIDVFAQLTDSGYVIPFDLVGSGGMVVASALGISRTCGSSVFRTPLRLFRADASYRKWTVTLEEAPK